MVQRYPSAQTFGNSDARLCLRFRWNGKHILLELSSIWAIALGAVLGFVALIYLVTSCYLVFRDEMLAKLLSNQAETQYAYEDRIAALRAHLDRVATRQLINQDSFEDKVNELIARQSQLETRQAIVNTIWAEAQRQSGPASAARRPAASIGVASGAGAAGDDVTGALPHGRAAPAPSPSALPLQPAAAPGKPVPIDQLQKTSLFNATPELRLGSPQPADPIVPETLAKIAAGMGRIEENQMLALAGMERNAQGKLGKWRSMIAEIGLDRSRFGKRSQTEDGVGGPLVPLDPHGPRGAFDQSVSRLQIALGETAHLSTALAALPVNRPLTGDMTVTSTFGARSDPFFHSAAMHTGVDFRGGYGSPVRVTAPGKVVLAGPQGGYGNMVEVDHGFGLSTRYAHLSSIDVEVGDTVSLGETVGHIGSTGRSTGPHLHYETRIDGEPADPMRFLQASARLGGAL